MLSLLLPARSTAVRRLSGLGVSIPLHAVALALLVGGSATSIERAMAPTRSLQTIASVVVPPSATPPSGDRVLRDEPTASGGDTAHEIVRVGGADIDISKIRARRTMLFPFLTLDLEFLEPLADPRPASARTLVNPLASGRRSSKPALELSEAAIQQVIDRAWSRRERWKGFAEMATLIDGHDANAGAVPALLRTYLDQNILQPFCDDASRDPRYWAMLDNAADHADFIDFVRSYARAHRSGRTTTELLFLLDELAQASRDALLMVMHTRPNVDLSRTARVNREGFSLAVWIRQRYGTWLADHQLVTTHDIGARYDELRLRLLSTIVATSPDGYRVGDARFLAGEILFKQGRLAEAERMWTAIAPDTRDSYALAYSQVLQEVRSSRGVNARAVSRLLQNEYGRWRLFNVDRLRQFGHSCSTF